MAVHNLKNRPVLNSKIEEFGDSFIYEKGYSLPFKGRE